MLALFCLFMFVQGNGADDSRNINIVEGQKVAIPCSTLVQPAPVTWRYQRNTADAGDLISFGGKIVGGYATRFSLAMGLWSLVIGSVTVNDSGIYTCTENKGLGTKHVSHLAVFKSATAASTPDSSTATTQQPTEKASKSWGAFVITAFVVSTVSGICIIIAIVVYVWKKRRCHRRSPLAYAETSESEVDELHNCIRQRSGYTVVCDARNDKLKGAAVSHDSVLVITARYNKIRQFSIYADNRELQPIDIYDLDPFDIIFCDESKCFVVAHKPPHEQPGCLYKISKKNKINKWVPVNKSCAKRFHPSSLSARSGRLLVISDYKELFLFDRKGVELNNFELSIPGEEEMSIKHAAETPNEHFVACVWGQAAQPQVILLNETGDMLRNFDDTIMERGLSLPHYLTVCRNGQIVVADAGNNRLVVLDASLKYVGVLDTKAELRYPWQFCYRETVAKLIVTCRERGVLVFEDFTLDNLREEPIA